MRTELKTVLLIVAIVAQGLFDLYVMDYCHELVEIAKTEHECRLESDSILIENMCSTQDIPKIEIR